MDFLSPNSTVTLRSTNFQLRFELGNDPLSGVFFWRDTQFREAPALPDGMFIEFNGEFKSSSPPEIGEWISTIELSVSRVAVESEGNWKTATGAGAIKSGFVRNPLQGSMGIHFEVNANIDSFGRVAYERLDGFSVV